MGVSAGFRLAAGRCLPIGIFWSPATASSPPCSTWQLDPKCPARRFALHCLYIYAADGIRTEFSAHPKRRLRKLVEKAESQGDELMQTWAYNVRMLLARPSLFDFHDWCEGGLVRSQRRLH